MKIEGKCCLVTGGANGIGLNIVLNFLKRKAKCVVILDFDKNAGNDAQKKLGNEFGKNRIFFIPCDVSVSEEFEGSFKKALEVFKEVDIFVNNSGIFNESNWAHMIDVNFKGLVKGTTLALEHMGKSKSNGEKMIVNIASVAGLSKFVGGKNFPVYSGTKYAVMGFSTAIKEICDEKGIRLLVICPGVVETIVYRNYLKTISADEKTEFIIQTPEAVGQSIVSLIEKDENKTNWVIEDNKPPYAVELPHYSKCQI